MTDFPLWLGKPRIPDGTFERAAGLTQYTVDVTLPGMLHAAVLRSPHAHARITKIDTLRAENCPGVEGVLTYKDVPDVRIGRGRERRVLEDVVRFVGDYVAAVCARDEDTARRALTLIDVNYEVLPAVFDVEEGMMRSAPIVCSDGNVTGSMGKQGTVTPAALLEKGDVQKGFREADLIFERTYRAGSINPHPLETGSAVAQWVDEKLVAWVSTQAPYLVRDTLAELFAANPSNVNVIARDIGGGFGAKDRVDPVPCIAAILSKKSKKPVKLWLSRREESLAGSYRASHTHYLKIGVKEDGTLSAIHHRAIKNEGAFAGWAREEMYGEAIYTIMYSKCPNIKFEGFDEYTNLLPTGPARGWNNQESHFPVEALMDEIAHALEMDPIELRKKNVAASGDEILPFIPGKLSSIGLIDCMEKGAELARWRKSTRTYRPDGEVKRGEGMAIAMHYAGFQEAGPHASSAIVEVNSEGRVRVRYAVPEIGTAHSTAIRVLVSEILRVNPSQVSAVIETANDECFANDGIHGSRTTTGGGIAAMNAANSIKGMLLQEASRFFSCDIDDLQFQDGTVRLRDTAKSLSFGDIVRQIEAKGGLVKQKGEYLHGTLGAWGFACGFAEVEVDCGTGKVKVVRYVVAQDVGRVINPLTLKGQVQGAVAMGIGQTLLENTIYDPINRGTCLNRTFADYAMPTILDVPPVETVFIESNEPGNPVGAKGGAEVAIVTVAPAICNAIYDALGVRFYEIPITPDRVLAALGALSMKGG